MEELSFVKKPRKAHVQKFQGSVDPSKIQKRVKKSLANKSKTGSDNDSDADDLRTFNNCVQSTVKLSLIPSALPRVIFSGSVTNPNAPLIPELENSDQALTVKINLNGVQFHNLRPPPKPDRLNEDSMFLRSLRMSYKRHQILYGLAAFSKQKKKSKSRKVGEPWENTSSDDSAPPLVDFRNSGAYMDWDEFFQSPENLQRIPPVNYFPSAPFYDIWAKVAVPGTYIELRNPFVTDQGDVYWIGILVHFAGYKGLVKFEKFEDAFPVKRGKRKSAQNYMVWISFCSKVPKPLGWCSKNGKKLLPGEIVDKSLRGNSNKKLKEILEEFYSKPHKTLAVDHEEILKKEFEMVEQEWKPSGRYEALDNCVMHQNRLVRVSAIVGNRVNVQFYDDPNAVNYNKGGWWFHWKSEQLHKFMWSRTVGVTLNGIDPMYEGELLPPETFPSWPQDKIEIQVGMRLEARHPFWEHKLVGAVVIKVLNFGYFMIETCDEITVNKAKFFYHVTSPYVFPVGFCQSHGIRIESFYNHKRMPEPEVTGSISKCLRLDLLPPRPQHSFVVGQKMEAIEISNSGMVGPVTIKKIVGHLLLLHFDGWSDKDTNHQWVDAETSEIYPAGYCELMGLEWQGSVSS